MNKENAIEFLTGDKTCTVSFTNPKHVNKIKKLYEKYPDDFGYMVQNNDGSVCAKIPLNWVRINKPTTKELTEEEKEVLRERGKAALERLRNSQSVVEE